MEPPAATAATLPDDVLLEILVRGVAADTSAALFRCATVCKRWRDLVADPSFLRRRWPEDAPNSSTLAGFFAVQKDLVKPVFVPAPRSPVSRSRRLLSSFCEAAGFLDSAVPLTSRRGLLLVRLVGGEPNQLAVCDILAGTCEILPPLKHNSDFDITGYTILTAADCSSKGQQHQPMSSFFRVLILGVNNHGARNQYYLLSFSSDESTWTAPKECPKHDDITHEYKRGSAVVYHGTAHWLFWCAGYYCTLDVSVDTGHVSLTNIPVPPYRFCYHTGPPQLSIAVDGTLSLLSLHEDGNQINVWRRREIKSGDGKWVCTGTTELKRSKSIYGCTFSMCVGERSSTLLLVDPSKRSAQVADLETGTMENVCRQFKGLLHVPVLPLMVDWPSFFMARLGDPRKRDARDINCEQLDHQ